MRGRKSCAERREPDPISSHMMYGILTLLSEQDEIDLETLVVRMIIRGLYKPRRRIRTKLKMPKLKECIWWKLQIPFHFGLVEQYVYTVRSGKKFRYALTVVGEQLLSEMRVQRGLPSL